MGIIKSSRKNPDGSYYVELDQVSKPEFDYFFTLLNNLALAERQEKEEAKAQETDEEDAYQNHVGETFAIPNGKYRGMVINDVFQEHGFEALAELLTHDPNFSQTVETDWQSDEYDVYMLIKLLQDLLGYISLNSEEDHLFKFVKAFEKYIGINADDARKMDPDGAKAFCLKAKDSFLLKIHEKIKNFSAEIDTMDQDKEILGKYAEEKLMGLSVLLRQKKSMDAEKYERVKRFALIVLKYVEIVYTFEEFYNAFGVFFHNENIQMETMTPELKQTTYHELVKQLVDRMQKQ